MAAAGPDDDLRLGLELACGYLNRRERTSSEVRRHLAARGVEEATAEEVIRTLTDDGYLDDARFARLFAQDKRTLEQWGSDRIASALLARGIPRELAEEALIGGEAEETELSRALSLLRRRFPESPRDRRERDRQLGVLVRKGYDPDLALDALSARRHDAGS